jgi:hypothetical protein
MTDTIKPRWGGAVVPINNLTLHYQCVHQQQIPTQCGGRYVCGSNPVPKLRKIEESQQNASVHNILSNTHVLGQIQRWMSLFAPTKIIAVLLTGRSALSLLGWWYQVLCAQRDRHDARQIMGRG